MICFVVKFASRCLGRILKLIGVVVVVTAVPDSPVSASEAPIFPIMTEEMSMGDDDKVAALGVKGSPPTKKRGKGGKRRRF